MSTLIRSPAFALFCESKYYLPGCHMQLTFVEDPAVCFQIVVHYLEEGSDQFGHTRLSKFVRTHLKLHDRFVLLLRLYRLASKLQLPVLVEISFYVMMEFDREMSAGYCITVTSLIFARNAGFDKRMKEWCMAHICNYSYHLCQIKEWTQLVPDLSLELQYHWANIVEENKHATAEIHEEMLGTKRDEVDELLSIISESERRTAALVERNTQDSNVEEVMQQVIDEGSDSDEEWEDLETMLQEPDRSQKGDVGRARASVDPARNDKAITVLGLAPSRRTIDAMVEHHNRRIDMEQQKKAGPADLEVVGPVSSPDVAKAKAVMGMNMLNKKHPGKTNRKLTKKVHKILHP